jgi:hypothetical protein
MNAIAGADHQWAYRQAVTDINSKGGAYVKELDRKAPLKLIMVDDKSNPGEGAAAMERLITIDHINLALSSNVTPINVAAAALIRQGTVIHCPLPIHPSFGSAIGDSQKSSGLIRMTKKGNESQAIVIRYRLHNFSVRLKNTICRIIF